eukprot:1160013-Pelagomonas_calceolata.AAC.8
MPSGPWQTSFQRRFQTRGKLPPCVCGGEKKRQHYTLNCGNGSNSIMRPEHAGVLREGALFPPFSKIKDTSSHVMAHVMACMVREGRGLRPEGVAVQQVSRVTAQDVIGCRGLLRPATSCHTAWRTCGWVLEKKPQRQPLNSPTAVAGCDAKRRGSTPVAGFGPT